jgi:hypothetical protein
VFDGGDDAVEVAADLAGEADEGPEPGALSGAAPGAQVGAGVGGVVEVVDGAEAFFEVPGAPEPVAGAAEVGEELAVVVVEALDTGAQGVAGAAPVAAGGARGLVAAVVAVDGVEGEVGRTDNVEGVKADGGLGMWVAQGSRQMGARSMEIASTCVQRSGPSASKKLVRAARLRPLATQSTRPVSWLATTVRYWCPRL